MDAKGEELEEEFEGFDDEDGDEEERRPQRDATFTADGKLRIVDGKCGDCIFNPAGKNFDLAPGRLKEIADYRTRSEHIACHNTYAPLAPKGAEPAMCGGFYKAYGDDLPMIGMARAMGWLEFVEPLPAYHERNPNG